MNPLPVLWLVFAAPMPESLTLQNPIASKAREHEEFTAKLKRDIFKVDRAIAETEKLIGKSRNTPYLPDLQFRLAELYVEKSRYVYFLQAEAHPEAKGALVSPETRLIKQKAVQIYDRILREFPDFKDGDKVTFYLAHEQRELGEFDEMLKTLGELIRKYPNSPARLDAEQILGDHFFDKADLTEAEKHYRAVLEAPPSPVHDLARYKMGWIRVNQSKYADAVTYFEAAAASAPVPGVDPQKSLNVKREALLDLVYSYTEVRPAKGALAYFEKLSDSRATYAVALEKLGNRYFIKQQYEYAIPALRKLMEMQSDPELDYDRAAKIYDSLKAAKGKVVPKAVDVRMLVRAAVEAKVDPDRDEASRKKRLAELEEMGRDLATQIHLAAQRQQGRPAYLEAAEAYKDYLALFRPPAYVREMMRNRADALFAAAQYPEAARQFEELARYEQTKNPRSHEAALYGALLAHYTSLKPEEFKRLTAFEIADARQALKLLGASYVSLYPRSEHAVEVKFNIARAFYESGEFERSAELFTAFALNNPSYKDAPVAGNLALDSLRQRNDFKGMEQTGRRFLSSSLPPPFLASVRKILSESRSEAIGELALKSSEETGDVVEGLVKVAEEQKGSDVGEKALYGAFTAARDKKDFPKQRELGAKFAVEYPRSQYISDVLLTLARHSAESGRFEDAAKWFEQVGQRLGGETSGIDASIAAAKLRLALGEYHEAIRDLESASNNARGRKAEVLVLLAGAHLKAKEPGRARATAEQALQIDHQNAAAAAIWAEVLATSGSGQRPEDLSRTLASIAQGPQGQSEDTAKGLWYLGEILYRRYRQIPSDQVDQKVAGLQELEGVYTQASQLGAPEWIVASLWKLGLAYQHLADILEKSPALKEQAAPLKERADGAFKACLSRAQSFEVFTTAVLGCRDRTDSPRSPVGETGSASAPANVEELQRKAEQNSDAASLEALGQAYLEARQLSLAQLSFGRAIELQESRPSAHNGLALTLLLQGDAMGARAAFGKALEADPTYDKARANLAALRCRYGDRDGAKRELAVLKDASVSGADVDPAWKSCR